MPYQIITSEKEKCVILMLRQDMKIEHFMQMVRKAGTSLREKGWSRIIMDARAQTSLFSTIEGCTWMKMITDYFPSSSRLALLTLNLSIQNAYFITQLFYKHTIVLDAFSNVEEAIEWLFHSKHPITSDFVCREEYSQAISNRQ